MGVRENRVRTGVVISACASLVSLITINLSSAKVPTISALEQNGILSEIMVEVRNLNIFKEEIRQSSVLAPDTGSPDPRYKRLDAKVRLFFEKALLMIEGFNNNERRSYYLALIAGARAAAGDIPSAYEVMSRIPHKPFMARAARDIAIEQAHSGDVLGAMHTVRLIWGTAEWALVSRAQALGPVAVAFAKRQDLISADRLLEEALQTAQSLPLDSVPIDKIEALIAVALAYAEVGHANTAAEIFREAYETTRVF